MSTETNTTARDVLGRLIRATTIVKFVRTCAGNHEIDRSDDYFDNEGAAAVLDLACDELEQCHDALEALQLERPMATLKSL